MEAVPDYTHVRNCNHVHATTFARYGLVVKKGHVCNNVRRGPWHGKTWGGDLREAAYCISVNVVIGSESLQKRIFSNGLQTKHTHCNITI